MNAALHVDSPPHYLPAPRSSPEAEAAFQLVESIGAVAGAAPCCIGLRVCARASFAGDQARSYQSVPDALDRDCARFCGHARADLPCGGLADVSHADRVTIHVAQ